MGINLYVLLSLFLLFHGAYSFNITSVLSQFSDFSAFNTYLTQTNLAGDINSRLTITILALDNAAVSSLQGTSSDVLRKILSVHVILDYLDTAKIQKFTNHSSVFTTLFQTTGVARGQQGFVNITKLLSGSIAFGSAVPGSSLGANLVKTVVSQPTNLSVLQISSAIVPQGIDNTPVSPTRPTPASPPTISPTPSVPSPKVSPPTSAPPTSTPPAPSVAPPNASSPSPGGAAPELPPADVPGPNPPADVPPSMGAICQLNLGLVLAMALSSLCLAA